MDNVVYQVVKFGAGFAAMDVETRKYFYESDRDYGYNYHSETSARIFLKKKEMKNTIQMFDPKAKFLPRPKKCRSCSKRIPLVNDLHCEDCDREFMRPD